MRKRNVANSNAARVLWGTVDHAIKVLGSRDDDPGSLFQAPMPVAQPPAVRVKVNPMVSTDTLGSIDQPDDQVAPRPPRVRPFNG